MHRSKPHHSIASSARACRVIGTMRPSAFAVFRLMTSTNLVGACTGRSARLLAPENAIDIRSRTPENIGGVGSIRHQRALRDVLPKAINHGDWP